MRTAVIFRCVVFPALLATMVLSCTGGKRGGAGRNQVASAASEGADVSEAYMPPAKPLVLTEPEQIAEFYRCHYWDNMKVAEGAAIDTAFWMNAFLSYIQLFGNYETPDVEPVKEALQRISNDKGKMDLMSMMAENILYDPTSPYRNEEFYIPFLEARISSGLYDEADVTRDRHRLSLVTQNRLYHKANDIKYTLKDGSQGTLYGIKAPYTLIFINNPGCGMCEQVRGQMCATPALMRLVDEGIVRILAVYPDEELDEWHEHYDEIPSDWINSYDKGGLMRRNGTYRLDAIPSLYLLDADKNVLVKDGTDVEQIMRKIRI